MNKRIFDKKKYNDQSLKNDIYNYRENYISKLEMQNNYESKI